MECYEREPRVRSKLAAVSENKPLLPVKSRRGQLLLRSAHSDDDEDEEDDDEFADQPTDVRRYWIVLLAMVTLKRD